MVHQKKKGRGKGAGPTVQARALASRQGWTLSAHPCFLDQLTKLMDAVEKEQRRHPDAWQNSTDAKLLAAIRHLVFEEIPRDPTRKEYRQGDTLGDDRKHWFRAKFGGGRFRLFFRFSSTSRVIIYAWVNDEDSLRTYGSKTDAYKVFASMLDRGNPPDDWEKLLASAKTPRSVQELERFMAAPADVPMVPDAKPAGESAKE